MPLPLAVPAIWRRVRVASGRGGGLGTVAKYPFGDAPRQSATWNEGRSDDAFCSFVGQENIPSCSSSSKPGENDWSHAQATVVMSVAIDPGATQSRHIDPSPLQAILYFPMYRV
jgi:hypothetical protein